MESLESLLAVSRSLPLGEAPQMVAGYHLIWTAYGCWLPNDPRGSSSHEIREEKLAPLGELHLGRKERQPPSRLIRTFYQEANDLLEHPRLLLADEEIRIVAASFEQTIRVRQYTCYACAIMPDHVHLVIRRHKDKAEVMIDQLRKDSRHSLIAAGRRAITHPVWGGPGWKVFLNTKRDIESRIQYVRNNPAEAGLPEQRWDFVRDYDGWRPRRFWED
jgi:REP element-mobilizing transposase RayT